MFSRRLKPVTDEQRQRYFKKQEPRRRSSRRRDISNPPKQKSRLLSFRERPKPRTCLLLAHLPAELRILIFGYVLGCSSDIIHILWMPKRLAHKRCPIAAPGESTNFDRSCFIGTYPSFPYYGLYDNFTEAWQGASRAELALLQTCRQVYTEAVDMLYSKPTFDFDSATSFMYFERAVLPQRLHAITSLQISWSFEPPTVSFYDIKKEEYLPSHWCPMCKTIMSMKRLLRLRLVLHFIKWSQQDLLLEPLGKLRGLKECYIQARSGNFASFPRQGRRVIALG
ncbi:uncharacterized protein BDZ99DRAFT_519444 [Mytilinidion resinicola]|uniref:DUF7730 domain-containing protein n=1 Tax=Mytilinidion resinicola TaxID=574789 RepID=A0A6A6YPF6_9PEZI|nr:uncharacterized protein BDZ99DRAFT_519444 [Mytilinidion resinicola]KAF2810762.1 hypothetical protein BDZ99DRAFT_519444 [Mytilinidion resinicola]